MPEEHELTAQFDPEDGGIMFLRSVDNHFH
jgi:hypothetical protein